MGIIDRLIPSRNAVAYALGTVPAAITPPWEPPNHLTRIAVADLFGVNVDTVTRAECMRVPAVARGRGLIVGHLARSPLTHWQVGPAEDTQLAVPSWLTSTNTLQSPRSRLAWTLDDLIFGGLSLWAVERDEAGAIVDAVRVDPAYWQLDPDTLGVQINGETVTDPASIVLFESWQEGLTTLATGEIQGSLDMSAAWRQRVASPVPLVELHETDPNLELEPDEIDDLLAGWEAARQKGGTAFTPQHVQAVMHGAVVADLFVEGRNAGRLDVANFLQVPANLLEGSMATASLTYTTQDSRRSDFVDSCLTYWAAPIEARLSMDDVTPDGTAIRFDLAALQTTGLPPVQPETED